MNVHLQLCIYLSAVLGVCAMAALYAPESGVIELTNNTFERDVLREDSGLWVVNFYAPWCRYSRNFTSEYSKAAKALKGFAKAGAYNCEQVNATTRCNNVYPTVIIFVDNNIIQEFEGESKAVNVTDLVIETVKSMITSRLHNLYQLPSNSTTITTDSTNSDPTTTGHPAST